MKKNNKLWKVMAATVMFVFALACTVKLTATATAIPAGNVEVDYAYETVTVTTDDDTVIYYTDRYTKDVSRWDACEVRDGKAAFDISWMNESRTVRLYLCGDVNKDVISVDVTWEENLGVEFTGTLLSTDITEADQWQQVYKNYTNFSEETGYLIFTLEENGRDMYYYDLDNILWRKGDNGVWRAYNELDLREMNIRGIRLEFQVKADNDDGARASSMGRINVASLSNAPKINVNPDSMSVSLRNRMEFSFDKKEWFLIPEYNKKFGIDEYIVEEDYRELQIEEILTNKRVSSLLMQEILKTKVNGFETNTPMSEEYLRQNYAMDFTFKNTGTEQGIVLYARESATEKKAASKSAELIIPYAANGMAEAVEGALKFSYGESKTNTGGIVVENTTADTKYQVGVITPEDAEFAKIGTAEENNLDLSEVKWISIKGGKTNKIANKKVPNGSYLIYRIAGEEGQLPSTYRIYGPLQYDNLTYAGIASGKKMAGETLKAVVSTNLDIETDTTLKFQWQKCADVKADQPVWVDIENATGKEYTLTNDEANQYVRVVITDKYGNVMYSDEVGPIKYVAPPQETPTPSPVPTPGA